MNKNTKLITIIALMTMLLSSILSLFQFQFKSLPFFAQWFLNTMTPLINTHFMGERLSIYIDNASGLGVNILDVLFLILIITGFTIYIKSKGNETRLLEMFFSLIIFSKCVAIFFYVINLFLPNSLYHTFDLDLTNIIFISLHLLSSIVWLKLSITVSRQFLKTKKECTSAISEKSKITYKDSLKPERVFHYFVDIIISLIFCFATTEFLFEHLLDILIRHSSISLSPLLIGNFSWFFYLVFFETLFETSPAKMLTNSKIIKIDGSTIKLKTILKRSLIRWIPFEPLSYIDNSRGWHDKWSKTRVIKVKMNKY